MAKWTGYHCRRSYDPGLCINSQFIYLCPFPVRVPPCASTLREHSRRGHVAWFRSSDSSGVKMADHTDLSGFVSSWGRGSRSRFLSLVQYFVDFTNLNRLPWHRLPRHTLPRHSWTEDGYSKGRGVRRCLLLCDGPWLGAREMVITTGPPNREQTFKPPFFIYIQGG